MRIQAFLLATVVSAAASAFPHTVFAQGAMAAGEVIKIDAPAGKITLRHGPIKNLNMEGMTMVFRVQTPAMAARVKVGDKVKFAAERIDGQFTITKMQKTK